MGNADLPRTAIQAEFEWSIDRTPERRKAADEAQARVLERMEEETR